ncbi:MAG: hypothetical protein ACXW61_06380 [Gemmatirosa sp.]
MTTTFLDDGAPFDDQLLLDDRHADDLLAGGHKLDRDARTAGGGACASSTG